MEIANMQAGSDMDELVAQKVMGLERHGIGWYDKDGLCHSYTHDYADVRGYQERAIWRPSTRIDNAWFVVEAMMGKGAAVSIQHWDGLTCPDTIWEVSFASPGFRGEACCHTAPLAICRAALRAVADETRPVRPA